MVKSLFDQSQDIDKQIEALKRQKIELKAQLDKARIKKLDAAGIESEEDLDILLGFQPSEDAINEGQDVYSPDGQVIVLSKQDGDVANTGYVMYKLDNGNLLFAHADDQHAIREEFNKVADDLAANIDASLLQNGSKSVQDVASKVSGGSNGHEDVSGMDNVTGNNVSPKTKLHFDDDNDAPNKNQNEGKDTSDEDVDMDKYRKIAKGLMSNDDLDQIADIQKKLNNGYK